MTQEEYQDLARRFGIAQADMIRAFDERHEERTKRDENIGRHLGSSATAPPPAATRVTPNFGGQPRAAFEQTESRTEPGLGKALAEIRDMLQQVLEKLDQEPVKPGFDKKGNFTPAGPGRSVPTSGKSRKDKDDTMQAALRHFVHGLRLGG